MYSPSRQTFHLAQGLGTDQTLFNFSFSAAKQISVASATVTATVTLESDILQVQNTSSDPSAGQATSHKGGLSSHSSSATIEVGGIQMGESTLYSDNAVDIGSCSALPSRSLVWSTDSEQALSDSEPICRADLSPSKMFKKTQNADNMHGTAHSDELSDATRADFPYKSSAETNSISNAKPVAKKASRFVWREVGVTVDARSAKGTGNSYIDSYDNHNRLSSTSLDNSIRASAIITSTTGETQGVEEARGGNLPQPVDITPMSSHDGSTPSQREAPVDPMEGGPGDEISAVSAPVLWHFNPVEVLQRYSNTRSNSKSNVAPQAELNSPYAYRSSAVSSGSDSTATRKSADASPIDSSALDAPALQGGPELTAQEAERLLSRVLKKNVRDIRVKPSLRWEFHSFVPNSLIQLVLPLP